ncbi:hypothetical protein AB3G34_13730 [Flavobacterium sp. WC2409]|uniref:Bacteriocin n=1 Tax=Flavobacterium sp. WC2409 TaxID=3234139 RepID=A0AB39W017_9FLAO
MKKINLENEKINLTSVKIALKRDEMLEIAGGSARDWGCGAYGLAAGIAAGFNPLVGGLTTFGCYMLT